MADLYSFSFGNVDYSWDTDSNWQTTSTGEDPVHIDRISHNTLQTNSFTFGDNSGGAYTALYTDNGSTDSVFDLSVTYSGATIKLSTNTPFGELDVYNSITISAGVFDLGDGTALLFQGTPATPSFTLNGKLQGAGFIDNTVPGITGTGAIEAMVEADTANLYVGAAIASSTIAIEVDSGANIEFGAAVASGTAITMLDHSHGQVLLDDVGTFSGTINLLGVNEADSYIIVNQANADHASFAAGVITVFDAGDTILGTINVSGNADGISVMSDPGTVVGGGGATTTGLDIFLTCFATGTQIHTPTGVQAVEAIQPGDLVVAMLNGAPVARPVKWVGNRKLNLETHANRAGVSPIRIMRNALGQGLPARDLLVSPCHCMYLDGKLVPAGLLVNGRTIVRDTSLTEVEYFHIELDSHGILIAEGVETESYLDTGNRAFFSNAGLALILHPEFQVNAGLKCWETDACAPLATTPEVVAPIWQVLADRADKLGVTAPAVETVEDADLHIVVDGRRFDAVSNRDSRYVFAVPAGARSVELVSRSFVPADQMIAAERDTRNLGVRVDWAAIRWSGNEAIFSADHPALQRGWYGMELAGTKMYRWTNGKATVPWETVQGPAVLTVRCTPASRYPLQDPIQRIAA